MPAQRIVKLRREEEERKKNDHQDLTGREDFAVEAEADDDKTTNSPIVCRTSIYTFFASERFSIC